MDAGADGQVIDKPSESDDDLEGLMECAALLTPAERRELLRNRCLLKTPEAVETLESTDPVWARNLWPYDWPLTVPRDAPDTSA